MAGFLGNTLLTNLAFDPSSDLTIWLADIGLSYCRIAVLCPGFAGLSNDFKWITCGATFEKRLARVQSAADDVRLPRNRDFAGVLN